MAGRARGQCCVRGRRRPRRSQSGRPRDSTTGHSDTQCAWNLGCLGHTSRNGHSYCLGHTDRSSYPHGDRNVDGHANTDGISHAHAQRDTHTLADA